MAALDRGLGRAERWAASSTICAAYRRTCAGCAAGAAAATRIGDEEPEAA